MKLIHMPAIFALLLIGVAAPVVGTETTSNGIACFSKDDHDQLHKAIVHIQETGDRSWFYALINSNRCFVMREGLKVTIKDYNMLGGSQIYLHPPGGGQPTLVWTVNDSYK